MATTDNWYPDTLVREWSGPAPVLKESLDRYIKELRVKINSWVLIKKDR